MRVVAVLTMMFAVISARADLYKEVLERKYDVQLERLEVISFSSSTKVLWFDWERKWWGGLNVIETTEDGRPEYWHDIPQPPTAQSIESIRIVTLSDQKFLEIIDCTHMGNGMLYLYEVRAGVVRLRLKTRVIANLLGLGFEPRLARVEYSDLDGDGVDDVVVKAEWVDRREPKGSEARDGKYQRVYYFRNGSFQEDTGQRRGRKELFD